MLAEADLARLIREVDEPENNFPKLRLLCMFYYSLFYFYCFILTKNICIVSPETFQPEKLIHLLQKRQVNSPMTTAMDDLEEMFKKLKLIAAKYPFYYYLIFICYYLFY